MLGTAYVRYSASSRARVMSHGNSYVAVIR